MKKSLIKIIVLILILTYLTTLSGVGAAEISAINTGDTQTMYSMDGREITVYKTEVEAYKKVGWYEDKSAVQKTMYSMDGREITVYKTEVEAYKKVGWYEDKSAVQKTMYSMDGREITVYKSEVEAYKKVGWYEDKSAVQKTLYSTDGREISVYKSEVEAYKKVGWYESKELVKMCSLDGRYRLVPENKVSSYQKVGWYLVQSEVIDPSKPMIALTFDDGPRAETTGRILDVLELFGARATFFVVGNLAARNPDILKRAGDLGCLIGNHTYSHPELTKLSLNGLESEIDNTSSVIYKATGKYPTLIRPPYGDYNQFVKDNTDKPLILWSVDTLDWKYKNSSHVINHVLSNVKDGDIILMHDLYDSTAAATEKLVPELIKRGFQLVTVEELSEYKNKPMKAHSAYSSFR